MKTSALRILLERPWRFMCSAVLLFIIAAWGALTGIGEIAAAHPRAPANVPPR